MLSKNCIRVAEFEKLYYNEEKPFKQKHWEALCRYLEDINKRSAKPTPFFHIINKGIQFINYVGVIQAGNLTIEVLPKTDKGFTTAANESIDAVHDENKQRWHNALLQMLGECRFIKVYPANVANLNLQNHSILDVYQELFLDEAERLLHKGLMKKYHQKESNQSSLKGQLLFQKQLVKNSLHQERFYVRNTTYDCDNVYNRILFKTLQLIHNISNSTHLIGRAGRLLLDIPELSPINVSAEIFGQLAYDRKTAHYKEAMLIAEILLLNYHPDITGGTKNIIAILFDMNMLWEEWVYRRLKKEEANHNIAVLRQQSKDFWKGEHMSRHKTIRPDIIIESGNKKIIVDTKWKLVENMTPSDEDLKQIFVYNLYWQCNESILLYPANEIEDSKSGSYFQSPSVAQAICNCKVIRQSVFDKNGNINPLFGNNIIDKILMEK